LRDKVIESGLYDSVEVVWVYGKFSG